mgnify:FL=1
MAKYRRKKTEDDDWDLDDYLFAKWFAEEEEARLKRGVKTIVNPPQANKFVRVLRYFQEIAKEYRFGKVTYVLNPEELCGFINVELSLLNLVHDELTEFIKILCLVDVLEVSAKLDGHIELGMNINNVFIEI